MYEAHFGMEAKPFSLSPDPRFLFLSKKHAQAYAMLQYGIREQLGFAVVTGEVGAGKTTLLRKIIHELDERDHVCLVSHTHQGLSTLMPTVLDGFGILEPVAQKDDAAQFRYFVDFLVEQYAQGHKCILIIDEAQNLSVSALEQLRLLSNVNSDGHLLIQTVLIGQPELRILLRRSELRQLAQRISVDFFLSNLDVNDSVAYINHRLRVAGAAPTIFEEEAKELIADASGGIPRIINNIADMSLVYAFGEGKSTVDESTVCDVLADKMASGILPISLSSCI